MVFLKIGNNAVHARAIMYLVVGNNQPLATAGLPTEYDQKHLESPINKKSGMFHLQTEEPLKNC